MKRFTFTSVLIYMSIFANVATAVHLIGASSDGEPELTQIEMCQKSCSENGMERWRDGNINGPEHCECFSPNETPNKASDEPDKTAVMLFECAEKLDACSASSRTLAASCMEACEPCLDAEERPEGPAAP